MNGIEELNQAQRREAEAFAVFWDREGVRELAPLRRAPIKGWVQWAFWGLRAYIVIMLVLVTIGFTRGMH
ncbi:MAG: hypothetical protein ACYDCX_06725 [Acidithiobacillus sp.]